MANVPALIVTNSHILCDNALQAEDDKLPILRTEKDIEIHASSVLLRSDSTGATFESEKQAILRQIEKQIGSKQVTAVALQFVPDWVMMNAIQSELSKSWKDAHIEANVNSLS